jgi:hypothetical protein
MCLLNRFTLIIFTVLIFTLSAFSQIDKQRVLNFDTKQPSRFTENKGQITDQNGNLRTDIKYIYSAPGFKAIFKENSFSYEVFTVEKYGDSNLISKPLPVNKLPAGIKVKTYRVDVNLPGSNNSPQLIPEGKSDFYSNYYLSNITKQGIAKAYHFTKLNYKNIWPNIDIVFYAKEEGELKYDIILHPGADIRNVKMLYSGAENIKLTDGKLDILTGAGNIREQIPNSYLKEKNTSVSIAYNTIGNIVSFDGRYDNTKTLVIDPILVWATYYGATDDYGAALSTDESGNVFMSGYTTSTSSIASSGAYQTTHAGGYYDAFVVKFNNSGTRQWATYYGGSKGDYSYAVANDPSGNVIITGYTESTSGIASSGSHQSTFGGGTYDIFVAKFNASGSRQWATYYGGSSNDFGNGISCDSAGNIYFAGWTESSNAIATTGAHQASYAGGTDGVLAKFNSSGVLQWGTYYGGDSYDICYALKAGKKNNLFITGYT